MATITPQDPVPASPVPSQERLSGAGSVVDVSQVSGGIAISTVATGGLSMEERAQYYTLAINGLLDTRTLTPEPHATLHGLFLGPLHVTFGEMSPRVSRRTQTLCARDRFDGIALKLTRAGRWHGRVGGRPAGGGPGTMVLLDFAQTASMTDDGDRSFVIVTIPRALASRLAEDPATLHGRAVEAGPGAVLAGFLSGLVAEAKALRVGQGPALAEMLIELTALAFQTDEDRLIEERRGPERRLRDRVERLIAMRISASDLTPEWLARKMGVSRSELYAVFNGSGGVARLIWDRRLAAARAILTEPLNDRTIGVIALQFGFASDAHFSRAFKQRYGLTPTAARKAAMA